MMPARAVFRAARMTLHLAWGMMLALIYPGFSRRRRRRILQRWSHDLLSILDVRIAITANDAMHRLQPGIIVSNHISWLDVFVLNAVVPMRFVAKSEVRRWPLIGWLSGRTQTLYIERGRARDALRINKQLVQSLLGGESLAIFPEGTTTDGKQVSPFHASLLQPAIDAAAQIHPVAIRYHDAQGTHSTAPAYIDDMTLIDSLWSVLSCRGLHVHLVATPSLAASGCDRRKLAQQAHRQISLAVELLHAQKDQTAPCPERQSTTDENLQSLYGMLLFSPLARQEAPAAID
ncbi:MAG: lysophospholipid acyltransferase family protein [Gallionella sp.]|jgi:1-acyl-sn-glycerol-3-phosphate acyltransferase